MGEKHSPVATPSSYPSLAAFCSAVRRHFDTLLLLDRECIVTDVEWENSHSDIWRVVHVMSRVGVGNCRPHLVWSRVLWVWSCHVRLSNNCPLGDKADTRCVICRHDDGLNDLRWVSEEDCSSLSSLCFVIKSRSHFAKCDVSLWWTGRYVLSINY